MLEKFFKKIFCIIFAIAVVLFAPLLMVVLLLEEIFFSDIIAKLICEIDIIFTHMLSIFISEVSEHKVPKEKIRQDFREIKESLKPMRKKTISHFRFWLNYLWTQILSLLNFISKQKQSAEYNQQIIFLNPDGSSSFYTKTFHFLNHYFGIYRIIPQTLMYDNEGVIHIFIEVSERVKDNLTIQELQFGLCTRLCNSLSERPELAISPEYWNTNTIYFPRLEKSIEENCLEVWIAVSYAGMDKIRNTRQKEQNNGYGDIKE